MAKTAKSQPAPLQITFEHILGISALMLSLFHMWLSFARHFFAPENRIYDSSALVLMMKIERYAALILLVISIIYIIAVWLFYPKTMYRIREKWQAILCKESILLFCWLAYYILCCIVQSHHYTNIFRIADIFLFDMAISVVLLFPMALLTGYSNMRRYADIIFHIIMIMSTAFITWMLWNLFHLHLVELPNGLSSGMSGNYTFYPGVNQNIAAAIGTSMIMISLYMILCHPWPIKIIYGIALLIHLTATFLCGSRGNFVALLVALSAISGVTCWNHTKGKAGSIRIISTAISAIIVAAIIWWFRGGVFQIFESITHLSQYLNQSSDTASAVSNAVPASAQRSLSLDIARAQIWRSSLQIMFSSPRTFFFGIPLGRVTLEIKNAIESIYGKGASYAHAHNMILQAGLITGVPGMLMFLAFLVMMVFRCVRVGLNRIKADFPGAYIFPIAILAMVIVNMFEPFLLFYISVMGCLFFLFCGWTVALDQASGQHQPSTKPSVQKR